MSIPRNNRMPTIVYIIVSNLQVPNFVKQNPIFNPQSPPSGPATLLTMHFFQIVRQNHAADGKARNHQTTFSGNFDQFDGTDRHERSLEVHLGVSPAQNPNTVTEEQGVSDHRSAVPTFQRQYRNPVLIDRRRSLFSVPWWYCRRTGQEHGVQRSRIAGQKPDACPVLLTCGPPIRGEAS
jgi:hypothetical protein